MYHPSRRPGADDVNMPEYVITCVDNMLRKYQDCGCFLTSDFTQLRDSFLHTHCVYTQVVNRQ